MERRAVSGTMITLLFMCMLTLAFNAQPVRASGTIYIRADGSIEPSTASITSADNVTYYFTGNIHETVEVQRENIIVDGDGFTLQGTGTDYGFYVCGICNVTIMNTSIKDFLMGIWLDLSSNGILSRNNITSNWDGIHLTLSSNTTISENNITNNNNGIVFASSSNNNVSRNEIIGNNQEGIWLQSSSENTLSENNITNNDFNAVFLEQSSNNSISGNDIKDNRDGIHLSDSPDNSISENYITTNDIAGILLSSSNNSTISGNAVSNGYVGIQLGEFKGGSYSSNNNSLTDNTISNNSNCGIALVHSATNTVAINALIENHRGIYVYHSSNSVLFHNNFINNTVQSLIISPYINAWDDGYSSGGNYWSDYSDRYPLALDEFHGEDQDVSGSDGVWDSPYEIDVSNLDRYPLTEPWSPPKPEGDVNGDGVVDIFDLSLVGWSYGSFSWDSEYNRKADLNYDGVVDIFDISVVCIHYGETDP